MLLSSVELTRLHFKHVHASHRLLAQQRFDVVPTDFETNGLFRCHRGRMMFGFLKHRRKTEKVSMLGLVDQDFLMIVIR